MPRRSGSRRTQRPPLITSQSMQLPPRFSADDDSQTDVCVAGKGTPFNMNQSFFQMLTATTSRMSSRFDEDSDDEDDGSPHLSESTTPTTETAGRGKTTSNRLLDEKGLGIPSFRAKKESSKDKGNDLDEDSAGEGSSALTHPVSNISAPIMSQMLQAQAQMNSSNFAVAAQLKEAEMFEDNSDVPKDHPDLAKKLTEIFNLPETEKVVSGRFTSGQLFAACKPSDGR